MSDILGTTTVGEILARDPSWPGEGAPENPIAELTIPALDAAPEWPGECVVFGMADEEYHAIPALSASGIKLMRQTPLDFWVRQRWLNADWEPDETDAKDNGKAFHARICEGRERFYRGYVAALDRADYPDALVTTDQIKAAIFEIGEMPVSKVPTGAMQIVALKSGNVERPVTRAAKKEDWIAQLLDLSPDAQIWDVLTEEHAKEHPEKTFLDPKFIRRVELAAAMIERHPDISRAFQGGYPEVSVFWICAKTGVRMKARFDYLKIRAVTDLKSLANQRRLPLDRAAAIAIASYGYHMQFALYLEAAEHAKRIARAGKVVGDVSGEWIEKWLKAPDPAFSFVMQQSGEAPVARMYVMPKGTVHVIATAQIDEIKRKFRECVETWGIDPWVDLSPPREMEDHELPSFISD